MIAKEIYEQAIFDAIKKGSTVISQDVAAAFEQAIAKESRPAAKEGLTKTYESILLSAKLGNPACPDTGWPIFYFKVGNDCQLEGGMMALEEVTRNAVRRATREGYLRATMKHPLTGFDPGDNVGNNVPNFTYQFVPGADLEVTYVAKGGGSECFGGPATVWWPLPTTSRALKSSSSIPLWKPPVLAAFARPMCWVSVSAEQQTSLLTLLRRQLACVPWVLTIRIPNSVRSKRIFTRH